MTRQILAARMATKTAIWHPKEQLLDHEWTAKWTLTQNGIILISDHTKYRER
jgi:hypothetical protein